MSSKPSKEEIEKQREAAAAVADRFLKQVQQQKSAPVTNSVPGINVHVEGLPAQCTVSDLLKLCEPQATILGTELQGRGEGIIRVGALVQAEEIVKALASKGYRASITAAPPVRAPSIDSNFHVGICFAQVQFSISARI
eukprot:TRINITY_DN9902_c0_g2_i3.p2 TRINITY_DN9902_c0_g2~~TRINITY_DN9902_c0_g2_i3.p2  ORF type:complete len:139 (+),score=12.80 TRINITY_DN9902_c0_g2_i3:1327-1743(+)